MLDASSSMSQRLVGDDDVEHYFWTPEVMHRIEVLKRENEYFAELVQGLDEAAMKRKIVADQQIVYQLGVPLNFLRGDQRKPIMTKMELVKYMAQDIIQTRIEKYPDAAVEVIRFESRAQLIWRSQTPSAMGSALDNIEASGGTSFVNAIRLGFDVSCQRPSKVGIHYFILVSDGEDWEAGVLTTDAWVKAFKDGGIVFDFIWIAYKGANPENTSGVCECKKLCELTGGEFSVVTTPWEFKQKFIEASSRKMLPPVQG